MPTQDTPTSPFDVPEGFEIPQGFAVGTIGTSNQPVLIPYYMVPALQQMLLISEEKKKPDVIKASAKPIMVQPTNYVIVGDVNVKVPPNPPPTDHDLMAVHAEVVALMQRFGISYKDACQRVYYQEHQRVITADANAKAWEDFDAVLKQSLHHLRDIRDNIRRESAQPADDMKPDGSKRPRS